MAEKVFTFEEVTKHTKKGDCWLIIDAKVYDVSQFLEEHPGGDEVILQASVKDATVDFEDIGHSSYAIKQREELLIGRIDKSTLPKDDFPTNTSSSTNKASSDSSKFFLYVLPLLILGVAFLLRFYYQN